MWLSCPLSVCLSAVFLPDRRGVERKEEGVQVGSERAVEETSEMRVDGELQ